MKLRFMDKRQETDDVWSFYFKPAESLEWIAGQSIRLEMPRKTWGYDERRFTIASAPHEKLLQITTRISGSEFKQNLHALKPGVQIDGHNIEGDFIWEQSDKPKLFLAAGIGITPFRSMLADKSVAGRALDVTVLYGSSLQPAVYAGELAKWSEEKKEFKLFITDKRIDLDMISDKAPNWQEYLVYVSGPEKMVNEVSQQLIEAGLQRESLRLDLFTGQLI